jgi:ribosomal-protein-alanine N-acetyltransferase
VPVDPLEQLFAQFPILETERLRLRPLTAEDARDVFAIFRDEAVTRFYDLTTFQELDEAYDLIEFMEESYQSERQVRWGIELKEGKRLVGTCGFVWLRTHSTEIGYDLAQAFWGQGIMFEALSALIDYAFDELELNRVEALVIPGNERSRKLLARLGFTYEGTLREYDFFKDCFQDLEMHALLYRDRT